VALLCFCGVTIDIVDDGGVCSVRDMSLNEALTTRSNEMTPWIKQGIGVVGLGLVVACGVSVAEERSATSTPRVTDEDVSSSLAIPPPAATPAQEESPKEKVRKEWEQKLAGTTWTLEVRSQQGGGRTTQDTLTLTGVELVSEAFSKAGYPNSNYSVTPLNDSGAAVETMQTHPKKGSAFWHLEIRGQALEGRVVKQTTDGTVEELSVSGRPAPEPPADSREF
jgi:hypothetical protein